MRIRLYTFLFVTCLAVLFTSGQSIAQISGITYPGEACAGATINVQFATTITTSPNTFTIKLVPATGNPVTLGTTNNTGTSISTSVTIPSGTGEATNYKIRVVSTTPSDSATGTTNLAIGAIPAKPLATTLTPVCAGTPITAAVIEAAVTGSTDLKWYATTDVSGPGNPIPVIPTPLSAGTVNFYVVKTNGSCKSEPTTIALTVNATPDPPTVTTPVGACVGASPAPTLSATGSNLKWYSSSDALLSSIPVISTASAGSATYKVSQTVEGCESPKASIAVTITAPPAAPTLTTAPAAVCVGAVVPASAFVNAVNNSPGTLVWYASATSNEPLTGSAVTVSTASKGTKSLYAARQQGSCESTRVKVDIEVKELPAAPTVANLDICVGDTPAPVLTAGGTNLKWFNSSNTLLATAPTISTTSPGNSTFYVSQTVNGCESPKATIIARVHKTAAPTVASSIAYCKDETPDALTATGTALRWYTQANGGTGSATPPTVSTATVGTVAYFVTQTLNGCESDRARIDVRTKAVPVVPVVTALPDVCLNTTVTASQLLSAVTTATGTLKWYTSGTGGTGSTTAPAPSSSTAGVKDFFVTQSVEGCESPRANIKMDVKALPNAPTVTATVDLCHQATSSQALTATPTGTNTLKWYSVATGGTALSASPVPTTTSVATTSYYVSQSQRYSANLSCESPRSRINVVVNPLPVVPRSTDQEVCQTRSDETLNYSAATTASGNTLLWYATASTTTSQTTIPSLSLRTPGESQYFVAQQTNKSCVGPRTPVKIRVKRLPALPTVSNLEYCQFENASPLTAGLEQSASVNWYGANATGGSPSSNAPVPSTSDGGNFSYFVSQTLEACEGDRAEIKVLIKTTPKPQTQTAISYCHNAESTTLSATGQRLKWYRPNGQSQDTPFTPFTASVGDQFFYVTQTGDNNCESPKEEIKITIHPLPSATISGQSSIPLGGTASIQLAFTGMGPWSYTLSNGFTGSSDSRTVSIQVQPAYTTSYLVTEVSNSCGKGIPNGSAVITVLRPTVTTGNPNAINLCAGSAVTVPFQQSGNFPSGSKFVLQISEEDNDESFETIPTTISGNLLTGQLPDTLEGGTYFIRAISENTNPDLNTIGSTSGVNIFVDPKPTATMPEGRTILAGQSTSLSIDLTGSAPWTFSYSDGQATSSVTTSSSPYLLSLTPETTTVYTITEVTNTCGNGRSFGETRVQVDPILSVEPTRQNWVKVLPTVVEGRCSVELDVASYESIELNVVDLSGRQLEKSDLTSRITDINMAPYPSGIYLFHVRQGREHAVIKVVKP